MVSNEKLIYKHLGLRDIYDTGNSDDGWFGKINILIFGDLLHRHFYHKIQKIVINIYMH
jgi:hypothetical protein